LKAPRSVAGRLLDETAATSLEKYLITHRDPNSPELEEAGALPAVLTWPTLARASVTARKVLFPKAAAPFTVLTRSARRWYTFSTCPHWESTAWPRLFRALQDPIIPNPQTTASSTSSPPHPSAILPPRPIAAPR
jgi:hypothetical protein